MQLGASYVSVKPKLLTPLILLVQDSGRRTDVYFQRHERMIMNDEIKHIRSKGGRPEKILKRDQLLGVKCTLIEKKTIEIKAESAGLTVSEFLREMGLTGRVDMYKKALPKEVLQVTGTMNHMAANLNQIAKKRNSLDELNAMERAELQRLSGLLKELAGEMKKYLK